MKERREQPQRGGEQVKSKKDQKKASLGASNSTEDMGLSRRRKVAKAESSAVA